MQAQIPITQTEFVPALFGTLDARKKWLEDTLGVRIGQNDGSLWIDGESDRVRRAKRTVEALMTQFAQDGQIDEQRVRYAVTLAEEHMEFDPEALMSEILLVTHSGRTLRPKTVGQANYIRAIRRNDIVFGIGPAGTGKTYLAMAMAVDAFRKQSVERIILTRPAVEAGESLGFLPGDLQEKIDPYLRPLYDALFDIMGFEMFTRMKEKGLIEVAPLAYMRGRTLDNAFIILDEAQNTSNEQMKMLLTRLGYGSKAVITGDITQIDLPRGRASGLVSVGRILNNVTGIEFVRLSKSDVVRHPLVQRIIDAYEKHEEAADKEKGR